MKTLFFICLIVLLLPSIIGGLFKFIQWLFDRNDQHHPSNDLPLLTMEEAQTLCKELYKQGKSFDFTACANNKFQVRAFDDPKKEEVI